MTTARKTLDHLLTDQEGVQIPVAHSFPPKHSEESRRTTRPFSEMKQRRFRYRFDRHQFISR